jgi:hypothetical protein
MPDRPLGAEDQLSGGGRLGAYVVVAGQGVDAAFDHLCLGGGESAVAQCFGDRCPQRFLDRSSEADHGGSGASVSSGEGGEAVLGGGPPRRLHATGGFELVDHAELDPSRVDFRASISATVSISSSRPRAAHSVSVSC